LVKAAVQEAMQPTELECPDCHAKFERIPSYLDHRVSEYVEKSLEGVKAQVEGIKMPTSEELLTGCKDGLCALIEETYDVRKKGEAPEVLAGGEERGGLFDYPRDEEEEPG